MKTLPFRPTSPYAVALLSVGLWQSSAWTQPADRVSLPKLAAPEVQSVAPLKMSVSTFRVAAALKKLRVGEMTPQQAWESKALDVDDLIYFLDKGLDSWGGFFWEKDPELRRALVALLVEHGSERLKNPEELSPTVRLWLADYYGSLKDERVLALAESILAKMPRPLPKVEVSTGDMPLAFQALERIAWYYDAIGQNSKCAKAWLRMSDYCPQKGWWLGDMWLMSARALDKDGKRDEAQKLRANVPSVGNGWITALAAYEEALPLINAGKLDEAKAILLRPLNATEQTTDGKIAQNAWLASLAYRQGNLEEALRHGQIVEDVSRLDSNINGPAKSLYNMGHDVYLRAGGWKTQPIQCDVKELILKTNPLQPDKPLYARFRIKTYGDTSVTATVDNPAIRARVVPLNNWGSMGSNAQEEESEVIIEASRVPSEGEEALRTMVRLNSKARLPNVTSISILIQK